MQMFRIEFLKFRIWNFDQISSGKKVRLNSKVQYHKTLLWLFIGFLFMVYILKYHGEVRNILSEISNAVEMLSQIVHCA